MVKIITDTTAVLPPEVAARYGIPVIPQVIIFGDDVYLEGVEIDRDTFMQRLTSARELPKTSAPPPELFSEQFQRLVPHGEPILCIHPSSDVSGTVRSAQVAVQDFSGADIRIIDTRLIASPLATVVQLAAQWAREGLDADTIERRVREMSQRCQIYFVVATLEYLARGGRIGGAAALLGGILKIKPILTFLDGRVEQFEKQRTLKRAVARLTELALEGTPRDRDGYLTVMHAAVPEQGQQLADELAAALGLDGVPIYDVPPAIVTHAGPGILGLAFFA